MIRINTDPTTLPEPDFSAGVNGSTTAASIDPLMRLTEASVANQTHREDPDAVAKLGRLTSGRNPRTAGDTERGRRFQGFGLAVAAVVTVAGAALIAHERSDKSEDRATIVQDGNSVDQWRQAQSILDPTNPDASARQAAEDAAKEILDSQQP